jgi:sulfatase maturation enzyme AslB (radical SAM superfamily)
MELSLAAMVAANQEEYGDEYAKLRFVDIQEAKNAEARRAELLEKLAGAEVVAACQGTKFFSGSLSPGCAACAAGRWSCLFINGLCNGRCFFCPTPQDSRSEPATNNLRFASPQDYVDYVARFGFTGVSISGGEPLMTFDRTLSFVTKLKRRFGRGRTRRDPFQCQRRPLCPR